jgi:bifunctional non-homologous end joining protein LigD
MECRFESLQKALAKLPVQDAILDGEVVCLDQNGMSRLSALLERRKAPVFYAFDLLWLDGSDLKDLPLIERKTRLSELVQSSACNRLLYAQHIEEYGRPLLQRNLRPSFGRYRGPSEKRK